MVVPWMEVRTQCDLVQDSAPVSTHIVVVIGSEAQVVQKAVR